MSMITVESSNVKRIGYENCLLIVEFQNGNVYSYSDVPRQVFEELQNAPSKGRYLNENIKGKYNYTKLNS